MLAERAVRRRTRGTRANVKRAALTAAVVIAALVWTLLATEAMNKLDEVLPVGSAPVRAGAA